MTSDTDTTCANCGAPTENEPMAFCDECNETPASKEPAQRACLRGEHEPLTAEDANGVFPRTFVGRLVALVCRHCRCLYAARAA